MVDYREIRVDYYCNMIAVVLQPFDQESGQVFPVQILIRRIFIKRENVSATADSAQDLRFFWI